MLTIEELYQLYFNYLNEPLYRNGRVRPRVRHPHSWLKLTTKLSEGIESPLVISPSSNVWVWSDLHFGHKNIISFSDRPYPDIKTMDKHLIENFNEYVNPEDISIWGGDISFYSVKKTRELIEQCNGYKIHIVGNHDMHHKQFPNLGFDEMHLLYHLPLPEAELVFTHYPMENLPKSTINVHGHLHANGQQLKSDQHINVCCEFHQYRPLNLFNEIYPWAKSRIIAMEG